MKHQYFGDVQDYRKYGLLRQLTGFGQMSLGVVWMLTPSDGRTDGNKTTYLDQPAASRSADPQLFDFLRECAQTGQRDVGHIEAASVLLNTVYFSAMTPDQLAAREAYAAAARQAVADAELVFFDPDNGFEVPSIAKGRRNSSKFVYWDEIHRMYGEGHSVLTYQHFPRVDRAQYTRQRLNELRSRLPGAHVLAFRTPHVGFFLALHERHVVEVQALLPGLLAAWGNVFTCTTLDEEERTVGAGQPPADG